MQISIPEFMKPWIDEQVRNGRYHTADELVLELLHREQERESEEPDDRGPAHLSVRTKDEVAAKLLEALDSGPATPMTSEDWEEIRHEVRERSARRPRTLQRQPR